MLKYNTDKLSIGSTLEGLPMFNSKQQKRWTIQVLIACEYRGKFRIVNRCIDHFWLDVVCMSRTNTNCFLDQYEAAVDEIIADCHGDLRGALRALMLANEHLEQELQHVSAQLFERLGNGPPEMRLH